MLWMTYRILYLIVCLITNQIVASSNDDMVIKKVAKSGPASAQNPLLFDHIFIMVMENTGYDETFSSASWQSIIKSSAWLTDMNAITHPSQPNYISMIAGSTLDCVDDDYFSTDKLTIIDLLNKAGVSWKSYQENYIPLMTNPNCNDATNLAGGLYVRRHNPIMFSERVRNNVTDCRKIVNSNHLAVDLIHQQLPQFSFYTPNMNNNAHNTNINYAGNYLQNWLNVHLNDSAFMNGTLLIVTFDEDEGHDQTANHIPTFMWGTDYLYSGVGIPGNFNLYSIPKLLEENWGLDNLGREEVTAPSLMNIWRSGKGVNGKITRAGTSESTTTQSTPTATTTDTDIDNEFITFREYD